MVGADVVIRRVCLVLVPVPGRKGRHPATTRTEYAPLELPEAAGLFQVPDIVLDGFPCSSDPLGRDARIWGRYGDPFGGVVVYPDVLLVATIDFLDTLAVEPVDPVASAFVQSRRYFRQYKFGNFLVRAGQVNVVIDHAAQRGPVPVFATSGSRDAIRVERPLDLPYGSSLRADHPEQAPDLGHARLVHL